MKPLYDYDYFKWLYLGNWRAKFLRIADTFPALVYAHGISFQTLVKNFPDIYYNQHDPEALINTYTIDEQINFVNLNSVRQPKHVLEIGAGRGELACTLAKMGIAVSPVEIAIDADVWFKKTGELYFGKEFVVPKIVTNSILDLDFGTFDTIIMIEVLEHIHEDEFNLIWNKILNEFHGLFIVTNYIHMDTIPIGGNWPRAEEEHCRLIDNNVYDNMCSHAKSTVFRKGSHLVLEF